MSSMQYEAIVDLLQRQESCRQTQPETKYMLLTDTDASLVTLQVAAGEVEIQGGIYDLETGCVDFLGESPNQASLVKSGAAMPPSIA